MTDVVRWWLWPILLTACGPGGVSVVTPDDSGTSPSQASDSGGVETENLGSVDDVETWPQRCPDLFDPDELPTFQLTLEPVAWNAIENACSTGSQDYHPAEFTYEDETVSAMVRLKGNWSWTCDKLQFVVSFNEEDPQGRFHGLRKLVLDAPWYDHTMLHERLAFPLFEARGLPYSCTNNVRLEINGSYYGLYVNPERLDREYLERNFEEPDGNLYQGGSELKTNEDVGDTSRLEALQAARTVGEIAALVDLDQAVSEWAVEAMIPAMDNYWAGVQINYYLYDHPSRGFVYLPYDLDISWGDSAYSDGTLIWPDSATVDPITYEHTGWQKEELVMTVLSDRTWCTRFVEALVEARALYEPEALVAQVETWQDQIAQALAQDPHKTFSDAQHSAAVSELKTFFDARATFVDAWLVAGEPCPATW